MRNNLVSFIKFSLGSWINAIINILLVPIITRIYMPEVYGKVSIFLIAINVIYIIIMLGVDQTYIRYYKDLPSGISINGLFRLCLLVSLGMWLIFVFGVSIFWKHLSVILFDDIDYIAIICLCINCFSMVIMRFLNLSYRMGGKPLQFSIQSIASNIVNQILAIIIGNYIATFDSFIISYTVGTFFVTLFFIFIQRDLFFISQKESIYKFIPEAVKFGISFVPTFLINWLNESVPKVLLKTYAGFGELGIFSSAFRLVSIMNLLQVGFTMFWTPYFYENWKDKNNNFDLISRVITFSLIILAIIIIAMQDVIFLIVGPNYSLGKYFFHFLLWIPIMYTISEITVGGINLAKKTWMHLVISLVVLIVNTVFSYILIPIFESLGAAISIAIAYLVLFVLRTYLGQKNHKTISSYDYIIKSFIILLLLSVLVYVWKNNVLLRSFACIGATAMLLFVFKRDIVKFVAMKNEIINFLKSRMMKKFFRSKVI